MKPSAPAGCPLMCRLGMAVLCASSRYDQSAGAATDWSITAACSVLPAMPLSKVSSAVCRMASAPGFQSRM